MMDRTETLPLSRHSTERLVFPIVKALYFANGDEVHKLIGTGFFVGDLRFLTAAHVFEGRGSAFDLEGASGYAVYCVHTIDLNRRPVARYIDVTSIVLRRTDVAEGVVETQQFGRGDTSISDRELASTAFFTKFTADPVPIGTRIYTIAYPLATVKVTGPHHVHIHAQSDAFEGRITQQYLSGRDTAMLPWPCYETDMEIKSGASGGPVIIGGSAGTVFAINCSGIPDTVSYVTSLSPLLPSILGPNVAVDRMVRIDRVNRD